MGKIMKPGRVVLTLGGRYAGRKAVVVKVTLNIYLLDTKNEKF
jgi:ribosomal protein L14E/L6E/L27E